MQVALEARHHLTADVAWLLLNLHLVYIMRLFRSLFCDYSSTTVENMIVKSNQWSASITE